MKVIIVSFYNFMCFKPTSFIFQICDFLKLSKNAVLNAKIFFTQTKQRRILRDQANEFLKVSNTLFLHRGETRK